MKKKFSIRKIPLLALLTLPAWLPVHSQNVRRSCIPVYCATNFSLCGFIGQTAGQPFCTLLPSGGISLLPGFQQALARTEVLTPVPLSGIKLNIYPNPARNSFEIQCLEPLENSDLQVFNLSGKMILSRKNENLHSVIIDCSEWPCGLYMIRIGDQYRKSTFKISVNR